MKIHHFLIPTAVACGAGFQAGAAHATISCNVSPQGFTSVYDPTSTLPNDKVSSVTINCSRALSDATSVSYSLAGNNGLYANGQNNRARLGSTNNYLKYDVYKDAGYASRWGSNGGTPIAGTINFNGSTSASLTLPYYTRVTALQAASVGDYTDQMMATLTYGGSSTAVGAMPVLITTDPKCQFSTPPANMTFNYVSFQGSPASASTQFDAHCTSGISYTMSLGTSTGTLLGLTYNLSLSAVSGTGTGTAQTYSVNGSIAANQVGICAASACSASAPQTITISY